MQFNHSSHLGKHFTDQRYLERAPADCTSCHEVDTAARAVEPAGFEKTCAACLSDTIRERELVVLRLPEFEENLIDRDAVTEACGPTLESWELLREQMDAVNAVFGGEADAHWKTPLVSHFLANVFLEVVRNHP